MGWGAGVGSGTGGITNTTISASGGSQENGGREYGGADMGWVTVEYPNKKVGSYKEMAATPIAAGAQPK